MAMLSSGSNKPKALVPIAWVPRLEATLLQRDVITGFQLLDTVFESAPEFDWKAPAAISFMLCVAQFTDLGYRDIRFLDEVSAPLLSIDQRRLQVVDYFRLKLIRAYRDLSAERFETSIESLEHVLHAGEPVLSDYLLFLANFWKGRAHRKRGDYDHAQHHILRAQQLALQMEAPRLVAVTQIHESWLAFQRGERNQALQLLDAAEETLKPTGHALSLGNIESARGRFIRRTGEYKRALAHFESAVTIYRKSFPEHPNLARTLVNSAYVKRLIAHASTRRRTGEQVAGAVHAKSLQVSREALELLAEAGRIYAVHGHHGGTGSVLVNAAHIHLENGDIDQAGIEAERAFLLGKQNDDPILMARAQIVRSSVSLARADEQMDADPDIALHRNLSVEYADDAIALALHTQNRRLLAEAYITRGMAAADDLGGDWQTAKDFSAKASALLGSDDRDHLFSILADLKNKVLGATTIDETLRLWSDGQLGDRTFQQVQEDFAQLVIPKVWLRNGKNVTAVSKRLSISPKKIRRILRDVRQHDQTGTFD